MSLQSYRTGDGAESLLLWDPQSSVTLAGHQDPGNAGAFAPAKSLFTPDLHAWEEWLLIAFREFAEAAATDVAEELPEIFDLRPARQRTAVARVRGRTRAQFHFALTADEASLLEE